MNECPTEDAKEPSDDEAQARRLIAGWIDGVLVHVDPPDFLICRNGSIVGAVEVTRVTDENFLRLDAQLKRYGRSITSPSLTSSWIVWLDWKGANLRKLDKNEVVDIANELERVGFLSDGATESEDLGEKLQRLGIARIERSQRAETPCHLRLYPIAKAAWINSAAVDHAVHAAAERKKKVLDRLPVRRHLFVWVDPWSIEAAAAIDDEPTINPPALPSYVDEVWVANSHGNPRTLWHRTATSQWRVLPK